MDITLLPFSSARRAGRLLFVSGQVGISGGQIVPGGIRRELAQAVENIKTHTGGSLAEVVDVTAFLVDESDYPAFNEEYGKIFLKPYPTRTTVFVRGLPLGARVELKVVVATESLSSE